MSEDNWQNSNFGGSSLGSGEGEVPLSTPPQPNIETRTMASDLSSMSESGGVAPRPYVPPPSVPARETTLPPVETKKETFTPPPVDVGELPKPSAMAVPSSAPAKKSKNGLFIGVLVLIIVVGLSAIGYFFIYPKFFGGKEEVPAPITENAPSGTAEVPPPAVEKPPVVPAPLTPPSPPPLPTSVASHASFFKTAADFKTETALTSKIGEFSLADLKQALMLAVPKVPQFTEFAVKDVNGAIPSFYEISRLFAPITFNETTLQDFESDFTYFVYTDNAGDSWPGLVAKTKMAPTQAISDSVSKLESNSEAANLFFADPGAPSTWKEGQINNKPARYLSFSKTGASLSYAWFDDYLLISTNYAGAKEAAKRLGYQ